MLEFPGDEQRQDSYFWVVGNMLLNDHLGLPDQLGGDGRCSVAIYCARNGLGLVGFVSSLVMGGPTPPVSSPSNVLAVEYRVMDKNRHSG